jgi:hypothetical protein
MGLGLSIALGPGSATRVELFRPTRVFGGWYLVLVVPEQKLPRLGEASVLDLLDFAAGLGISALRSRAAGSSPVSASPAVRLSSLTFPRSHMSSLASPFAAL